MKDFEDLVKAIRGAGDGLRCEPLTQQQLLTRALLDYADLLIDAGKHDEGIPILSSEALKENLFAMFMSLRAERQQGTAIRPEAVASCRDKAEAAYRSEIEPRSRLLRGMILQKCCSWSPDGNATALALRSQLLADVALLEKQEGANSTAFSPVTRKNERLPKIRDQISRVDG